MENGKANNRRTRDDGEAIALLERRRSKMTLRFDRETRSFAEPERWTMPIAHSAQTLLYEVMGGEHARRTGNGFNDLGFYMNLCAREGTSYVEIDSVDVHHSDSWCFGIRVVYRSRRTISLEEDFFDKDYIYNSAPKHIYHRGYYSYTGGPRKTTRLKLEKGEFIAEIRTRQGEITDQIAFLTNRRTVTFGGLGGSGEDMSKPVDLSRRIVAFVGTSNGVLERLGAVSVSRNWEVIGHIVLLRALVERGRASRIEGDGSSTEEEEEEAVQAFIMDAGEDVFQRTLSFLAYGIEISD